MGRNLGRHSIMFKNRPAIVAVSAIVGPKEASGPYKDYFKYSIDDDTLGQDSFEKSERELLIFAIKNVLEKSQTEPEELEVILGGDLLNQLISSTFSAREFDSSFLGLYSACSTYTQAILLASIIIDGGYKNNVICGTCSHFSSVERQYRFPLELGTMRAPASQWTVTGGGACIIRQGRGGSALPYVKYATIGRVIDYGVVDTNNMGAAMAPADDIIGIL